MAANGREVTDADVEHALQRFGNPPLAFHERRALISILTNSPMNTLEYDAIARRLSRLGYGASPDRGRRWSAEQVIQSNLLEPDLYYEELRSIVGAVSKKMSIGVLEFGRVDLSNPSIRGKIQFDGTVGYRPVESHATQVPAVAGAWNDGIRISLHNPPFGMPGTQQEYGAFRRGIRAAAEGNSVVNISQTMRGGRTAQQGFVSTFEAYPRTLFVVSAGNQASSLQGRNQRDQVLFGAVNSVLVGAVEPDGELAPFSNHGSRQVALAAPGTDFHVFHSDGSRTESLAGTSFSSALVANVAVMMRTLDPQRTPPEIIAMLAWTSDNEPALKGKIGSGGVVNRKRALSLSALSALVHLGFDPASAAARLPRSSVERKRLVDDFARLQALNSQASARRAADLPRKRVSHRERSAVGR